MSETIARTELLAARAAGQRAYRAGDPFTLCPHDPGGDRRQRVLATAWLQGYRRTEADETGGLAATGGPTMTRTTTALDTQAAPPEDQTADTTAPAPDENGEVRWPFTGVACPDGIKTGDGRKLTNVTWVEQMPHPFRAQFSEQVGHDGAVVVGRIERYWLDGNLVRYSGTWDDLDLNEDAARARRFNLNGQMRGVSIDADEGTVSFEDGDGNPLDSEELWDLGPEDEVVMVVDGPRIRAITACMIPAYVEAYVVDEEVPEDQRPVESITAAAGRTGVGITAAALLAEPETHTDAAPSAWFNYPGVETLSYENGDPRGLTVTDDGRVYGYLATWGTCHIGIDGACVTPPTSATDYAHFLAGEYPTSDGELVPVGQLTMDTGHAGLELSAAATIAHYDNTGTAAADVTVGEDDRGIWFAGVLRDLSASKVRALRAGGKTSGDWRRIGGNLELVAALAVNVPGFPIPRTQARVASGAQTALVASAIVTTEPPSPGSAEFSRAVGEAVNRHMRARELSARFRKLRAATIKDRLDKAREVR